MRNKTFKCPYLTEEDKEFLKYELKLYKENFKMLLKFHKKHEKLLIKTDIEAENYDNAAHSSLCFDAGSDVFYALSMTHVHFVDDICSYFSITYDIKELNSEERTMEEVINETEMLTLDEVFDKYILKYLQSESEIKTVKRHAVLNRGEIYNNKHGGRYKCLDAYENGDAKLINIDSGWCFEANCVILYDDGTIEWDYSTDGEFVNYIV